jgi:hypothetical protein
MATPVETSETRHHAIRAIRLVWTEVPMRARNHPSMARRRQQNRATRDIRHGFGTSRIAEPAAPNAAVEHRRQKTAARIAGIAALSR